MKMLDHGGKKMLAFLILNHEKTFGKSEFESGIAGSYFLSYSYGMLYYIDSFIRIIMANVHVYLPVYEIWFDLAAHIFNCSTLGPRSQGT